MKKDFVGVKTYIADMESCGVYFTDEQKDVLENERDSLTCHYSGLPSLISYIEEPSEATNYSKRTNV